MAIHITYIGKLINMTLIGLTQWEKKKNIFRNITKLIKMI